jgi:hypothetical protein
MKTPAGSKNREMYSHPSPKNVSNYASNEYCQDERNEGGEVYVPARFRAACAKLSI